MGRGQHGIKKLTLPICLACRQTGDEQCSQRHPTSQTKLQVVALKTICQRSDIDGHGGRLDRGGKGVWGFARRMRTLTRATISVYAARAELGHSLPALFISSDSTRAHRQPSSAVAVRLIRSYNKQNDAVNPLTNRACNPHRLNTSQAAQLQTLKSCGDSGKQIVVTIVTFSVGIWGLSID